MHSKKAMHCIVCKWHWMCLMPLKCYVWVPRPALFRSLQLAEPVHIVRPERGADPSHPCSPGHNESVTCACCVGWVLLVLIVDEEKIRCIDMIHTHPGVGWKNHLGRDKTINEVMTRLFWPKISWDMWLCCLLCEVQQPFLETQAAVRAPASQSAPKILVSNRHWLDAAVQNWRILTAICYFSKWVELIPLHTKTALEVAEALRKLICKWGVWLTLDVFQSFEVLWRYEDHLKIDWLEDHISLCLVQNENFMYHINVFGAAHQPTVQGSCDHNQMTSFNYLKIR